MKIAILAFTVLLVTGCAYGGEVEDMQKRLDDLVRLDKMNSQLEQLNARHIQLGRERDKVSQTYRQLEALRDKLRKQIHVKPEKDEPAKKDED